MNLYSKVGDLSSVREAYQTVPRNFDIQGEVLKKDGRELRLQTEDGTVMDILLKKDMDVKSGQTTVIARKDVESIKVLTEKQEEKEIKQAEEDKKKLDEVGVKDNDENRKSLEKLQQFGVDPSKENIERFSSLRQLLENLKGYLTVDVIAELRSRGLNVDEISLADLDKVVREVRQKSPKEIADWTVRAEYSGKISDAQAKQIAKNLYGSEMGKDILDCIKALKQLGIEPTKENVDDLHDIFSKIYNIQDVGVPTLVYAIETKEEVSIDLLYKLKNYVKISSIEASVRPSGVYAAGGTQPITDKELTAMEPEILRWLQEAGLGEEYMGIAKELIRAGQTMDASLMQTIKNIQKSVKELQQLMDKKTAAALLSGGMDILSKDVTELLTVVKEIQETQDIKGKQEFTEREEHGARLLLHAIRRITPEKILADAADWTLLLGRKDREQLQELIMGPQVKEMQVLSKQEMTVLRTASILRSVHEIAMTDRSMQQEPVRLLDIAKHAKLSGSFFSEVTIEERTIEKSSEAKIPSEGFLRWREEPARTGRYGVAEHYQILRSTLRATHVYAMMREGMDPIRTDIRIMNSYVSYYEQQYAKYSMESLNGFDQDRLSIELFKSEKMWSLKDLSRNLDVAQGKSRLTEGIQKLMDAAELRDFKEIRETMRAAVQALSESGKESKQGYEESLSYLYHQLRETEELVKASKRSDKEIFDRYLKEVGDSIREAAKVSRTDHMIQIPLFMNGEGGSANVFAKSGKKGKNAIDPEDMSILMDLNMKTLGKIGFYLKVDHKEISIDLSVTENAAGLLKEQMESLSNLLSSAGYHLSQVRISTEESAARIAFTEDQASQTASLGLDVRV